MARRIANPIMLGVLIFCSSLIGARVMAQGSDGVPEGHRLVGSWLIVFPDNPNAPPSLYTFGADGTVVGSSAAGARHGSWEAMGERSAAFTVLGLAEEGPGIVTGLLKLSGTVDLDETGDRFTLTYFAEPIAPDGTAQPGEGPFTAEGRRIVVEPPTTPATPTPGEETPAAPGTEVASPVATG